MGMNEEESLNYNQWRVNTERARAENDARLKECEACYQTALEAYESISGNRLKANGALEIVEAIEKRLAKIKLC